MGEAGDAAGRPREADAASLVHPSRRRLLTPAAGAAATAAAIAAAALTLPAGGMPDASAKADPHLALLEHVPPSFAGSCVPAARASRLRSPAG